MTQTMNISAAAIWAVRGALLAALSACICAGLIVLLQPLLQRYALAKPNARSSHRRPTPQGGGVAVFVATAIASGLGLYSLGAPVALPLVTLSAAALAMACVGAVDDIRPVGVLPRLIVQAAAVAAVISMLPQNLRVAPILPFWIERGLLMVGGLWFVNLVNFMDGIDWMTVAEIVPITGALVVFGGLGALPRDGIAVALALGGAMLGFAHFNRPAARLFLGDVGSLPIGLVTGWLLVLLAGAGHLAAALLLPLYYIADATLTVIRRLARGERVWQAHRTHYYQRATDRGYSVIEVVARVFAVNLALATLALATIVAANRTVDIAALACGAAVVGWLLNALTRKRR